MKLIASLLLFYPLIVPVWKTEPLNAENSKNPESRMFLTKPEVESQIALYKEVKDPSTRSRIAFELVRSNNPAAVEGMAHLLRTESDSLTRTDLLKALYRMRKVKPCGKMPGLRGFLKDPLPSRRAYAAALMIFNSYDPNAVVAAMMNERSTFVLNMVFREMSQKPDEPSESRLLEALNSENAILAGGAAEILASRSKNPDAIPELAKIAEDKRLIVRTGLAAGLAKRKTGGFSLLTALAKDANSSVRSFVASAVPIKERLPLYLSLAKDTDWDVRRLAVESLGKLDDPKSIAVLRSAFSDPSAPVRRSAENSLTALNPSKKVLSDIVGNELVDRKSRPSAITVLGNLKFNPASVKIAEILSNSKNDDIILRSVTALASIGYNAAWREVETRASSPNPAIRRAVGKALGIFAEKGSYNTLLKLSDDKNSKVAAEALRAMGVAKSSFFNSRLLRALKQVTSSSDIRSSACWSVPKTGASSPSVIAQLRHLALDMVIPAMGMMEYDADFVRISAVLALIDLGKQSADAKKNAKKVLAKLRKDVSGDQLSAEIASATLREFARQAELYMNGKDKIEKTLYPTQKPSLTVTRMK